MPALGIKPLTLGLQGQRFTPTPRGTHLVDKLNLFLSGGADYTHHITSGPNRPNFHIFLRHCQKEFFADRRFRMTFKSSHICKISTYVQSLYIILRILYKVSKQFLMRERVWDDFSFNTTLHLSFSDLCTTAHPNNLTLPKVTLTLKKCQLFTMSIRKSYHIENLFEEFEFKLSEVKKEDQKVNVQVFTLQTLSCAFIQGRALKSLIYY